MCWNDGFLKLSHILVILALNLYINVLFEETNVIILLPQFLTELLIASH